MKEKRTMTVVVLSTLLLITLIIGGSYAYWKVTRGQEDANTLTTTCLDIDLSSTTSGINLDTQFPIPEEEGRATTGYTFKITNKCDTYVSYDINLESLNTVSEENRLNLSYLDAILDDGNVLDLGSYPSATTSSNSYDTRTLTTDTIGPKDTTTSTKEYTLRVWLDEEATNETMNKRWSGKISVSASPVIAENAVTKLTKLAETNTEEMFTDDTEDANIRYMGPTPSNYIDLGDGYYNDDLYYGYQATTDQNSYGHYYLREYSSLEACQVGVEPTKSDPSRYNVDCEKIHSKGNPILWRVIGVMNNVDDGTGKTETRLKVIRDENIGLYAFSEACSDSELNEYGVCSPWQYKNNWTTSNIKDLLNNEYYNKRVMTPYNGINWSGHIEKATGTFANSGIPEKMKNLIGDTVYHLGGPFYVNTDSESDFDQTAKDLYAIERSSNVYKGNPTTWIGKVGLIYLSDYMYSGKEDGFEKEYCNTSTYMNWAWTGCAYNNWLKGTPYEHWTMTPYSGVDNDVAVVDEWGSFFPNTSISNLAAGLSATRPALYLKSNVKIMGGDGTKESPYKIGL